MFYLAAIGFAPGNDTNGSIPKSENEDRQPLFAQAVGNIPCFSIITPVVFDDQGAILIEVDDIEEVKTMGIEIE